LPGDALDDAGQKQTENRDAHAGARASRSSVDDLGYAEAVVESIERAVEATLELVHRGHRSMIWDMRRMRDEVRNAGD
jgi:hypothetical protein